MNSTSLKILIVDDEPANRILLERFLKNTGHQARSAGNGEEAIRLFRDKTPDLVIMDVMMPGMSGHEVTRQFRELSKERWIPVIMTSGLDSPEDQIEGLQAGGDDYIVKPINLSILRYKIQAMQRIAAMQNALFEALQTLKQHQDKTEKEIGLAQYMMRQLTRNQDLADQGIGHLNMPAGAFSGDVVSVVRTETGRQYLLLADVTGHGLSSALNAIPLVEAFFEFAESNASLEILCRGINSRLNRILPPGYFVAAILVAIDPDLSTIQVWNGGLPPALFMTAGGDVVRDWHSRHLALGILKDNEFDASIETMTWTMPGQVIMFTDGLVEATAADGEVFGEVRLTKILGDAAADDRLVQVGLGLTTFLDGVAPHDDISLVTIDCD
ncbi:SpoIIE family protein phosphatase [Methylomonas sp. LL1]|uniref:fused response regulator/phosphatase n=1 Tax=Methylomonas sp. LL1 TaxID=2785785 RepID=UPI0018C3773B|nr:fused response regulator/phosphatase [Methylomonas sp. LL1]QPK61849.1 SpoIIE family protein phosphatase [Methylomonas sp. LL1]